MRPTRGTWLCVLVLCLAVSLVPALTDNVVLKGVKINIESTANQTPVPRLLLQNNPKCGDQFSVKSNTVQSGYYYFGCFRESLTSVPCVTFGTRIRGAPGLQLREGWMTIENLNLWKSSQNQLTDWAKYVEPTSVTSCTGDILGKCDMAGVYPTPNDATFYCNVLYAIGGTEETAANRTTIVKLGGLDRCEDC